MHKINKNSNHLEAIFSELGPEDFPYPRKYRFFDGDYARENQKLISNASIRNNLHKAANLGKIVFDHKKHHGRNYGRQENLVKIGAVNFEFYDFFALANLLSSTAKYINSFKSVNKLINFFEDFEILKSYQNYHINELRSIIESYKKSPCHNPSILPCLHPYIRYSIISSNSELRSITGTDNYKKSEDDFIRTANANRKKINEFLIEKFINKKKIFICRLDVVLRNCGLVFLQKHSISNYRKQIDSLLEKLVKFDCALDIIFPSALLSGEMMASNFPVGQIVLVSTERVSANKKDLKEFASQVSRSGFLDFMPAKPFPKDLAPNVDGVLEFTPSTVEAIKWLAEFLTIERRFVAPGQGCTDGNGTAHCFRYIDLKR